MNDARQYDACVTPTSDHIARFWRLLEEGHVRIVIDTHHPEWFGGLGEWASCTFSDAVAKALVAERAAAPDLLKALRVAAEALDALDPSGGKLTHPPIVEFIEQALAPINAAIAKAERLTSA